MKRACPAGRYGLNTGISSELCTGPCDLGYYCPIGSSKSTQFECGGSEFFCPIGSATPQHVYLGYYTGINWYFYI